jgi:hypothetical protein
LTRLRNPGKCTVVVWFRHTLRANCARAFRETFRKLCNVGCTVCTVGRYSLHGLKDLYILGRFFCATMRKWTFASEAENLSVLGIFETVPKLCIFEGLPEYEIGQTRKSRGATQVACYLRRCRRLLPVSSERVPCVAAVVASPVDPRTLSALSELACVATIGTGGSFPSTLTRPNGCAFENPKSREVMPS